MRSRAMMTLLAAILAACGSERRVDLAVDKSKPASALTEAEVRELCKQGLAAFKSGYGNEICAMQGLAAQYSEGASCATARQSCLGTLFDPGKCDGGELKPLQCDVPVRDVERCINDTLAQLDDLPAISCSSSVTELQQLQRSDFEIHLAPSCDAVAACGDLDFGVDLDDSASLGAQ